MAHSPRMLSANGKTLQSFPPADSFPRTQTGSGLGINPSTLADQLSIRRLDQNQRIASKDYSIHSAAFRPMQHTPSLRANTIHTVLILSQEYQKPDQRHPGQDFSSHHLRTKMCPPKRTWAHRFGPNTITMKRAPLIYAGVELAILSSSLGVVPRNPGPSFIRSAGILISVILANQFFYSRLSCKRLCCHDLPPSDTSTSPIPPSESMTTSTCVRRPRVDGGLVIPACAPPPLAACLSVLSAQQVRVYHEQSSFRILPSTRNARDCIESSVAREEWAQRLAFQW
ncbi:hypothetical protein EDD18DRAFT_1355140 [Armillaria luteobubalina]|uniref:Uncharacterized protein n=1 Tax=Armillaria luteobubalina TaxID=153913 RepID=A0AA39URN3_9AGAR|nr:hypothetical protein EDD18DRAFT_1355140 [Armillaria luteobubalina]